MANIHIPIRHQSAPNLRHDGILAREAAAAAGRAEGTDWDAIDWAALHPEVVRRRRMVNQDFDREQERVEKARMVRILHPNAVMARLRAAGVDARTEQHPNARLWLNDWTCHGMVGVNAWVQPQEMDEDGYLLGISQASSQAQKDLLTENFLAARAGRRVRKTLTSLQDPYGPEWSVMRFDEHGAATKEKYRGWRTAMLVLIVAEVLTEAEVDRAFGRPAGEAGAWYRQQLKTWRQIRLGKPI
jgi:hypothetical protein